MAINYTTFARVVAQIPMDVTQVGVDDTAKINDWITEYSRFIDNYLEVNYSLASYPIAGKAPFLGAVNYDGTITIHTDVPFIQTLTGVSLRVPRLATTWTDIVLPSATIEYYNDPRGASVQIYDQSYFFWRGEEVQAKLTMTAGYSTITAPGATPVATDLPIDFVQIATELVAWAFNARKSQTGQPMVNPITGQGYTVQLKIPQQIVNKLDNFKPHWIPGGR